MSMSNPGDGKTTIIIIIHLAMSMSNPGDGKTTIIIIIHLAMSMSNPGDGKDYHYNYYTFGGA